MVQDKTHRQWKTNRILHVAYRTVPLSLTLSDRDPEGHVTHVSYFKPFKILLPQRI